jgi:hypothetical protein
MAMTNKNEKIKEVVESKKRFSFSWLIIFSVILGLSAGLVGAIIAKNYILSDKVTTVNTDISQDALRRASSIIIDNAKKIVVEQDNKVKETVSSAQNSIVGIFKKKEETAIATTSKEKIFSVNDYYRINDEVGEGLIVTSDGWVIAPEIVKGLSDEAIIKNYVVVTKTKNIYTVDKILKTGIEPYVFIHLTGAKDLPVKGLATLNSLTESQLLVAVNWQGKSYLSSLFEKEKDSGLVKESDSASGKMVLSDSLDNFFSNAFLFSLNGEAAALFNQKSGVVAINNFLPIIKDLLEKKEVKYPSLGVSYINLNSLTIKDPRYERGALIYSEGKIPAVKTDGAAAIAGLKEGDIILSVDSTQMNAENDLAETIRKKSAGDEINILYLRNGEEKMLKVKLLELKPVAGQKI